MAKLSGVKTLDMVNGEITKVEYNGELYAKVDGKAQAGDLIYLNKAYHDTTVGAYYLSYADTDSSYLRFKDDVYDTQTRHVSGEGYFVPFRKVTATDVKYRLITDRKPKAGDFAKLLATDEEDFTVGNYYEILGIDSDGDFRVNDDNGYETYIMESEGDKFEVYEKGTKYKPAEPLKVGDYAKVVGTKTGIERLNEGDIVELRHNSGHYDFRCFRVTDGENELFDRADLVKVTDEEVAEVKLKQAELARWTAIGRKPNEFKKGDIVRVLVDHPCSARLEKGDIGEITIYHHDDSFNVTDKPSCLVCSHHVELITPVEHRFDKGGQSA